MIYFDGFMHIIEHLLNKSPAENQSTFLVSIVIFLRFSFDFTEEDENKFIFFPVHCLCQSELIKVPTRLD